MSVSHTVVSWIQVLGLIVGLYGFFFVSIGMFGDTSARWFAALLPALASGLGALLYTLQTSASWVTWLATAFSFAYGYWIGLPPKHPIPRTILNKSKLYRFLTMSKNVTIIWAVGVAASGLLLAGILFIVRHTAGKSLTQHESFEAIAFGGAVLILVAFVSEYWLPRVLQPRILSLLGFTLSVLAILTQFIPPVLDLLNIPVK